jgi:ABC-2 type transport system permease protein
MNLLRILKGNWFPLDLAPMWFQNILSILPFQYSLFYPIKIITSYIPIENHIKGILVLVFSIILLMVIIRYLWFKGIKRYDSVGN